jgi:4-amino-4-deoxy-L-arabinose transferase-like glycosyltransferase
MTAIVRGTAGRAAAAFAAILLLALALRTVFPAADPPWNPGVGVVWHDEGAWVHNARNRALFGAWSLDAWNPMYVAPVFTALEYASFSAFGVGVRQARLVSMTLGWIAVLLLALGVRRAAGTTAGLIAAGLLGTNYVTVMYDRAATMEASTVAFLVCAWYAYVRAQAAPAWGLAAGICAMLAFFTKASAAFFVGALGMEALIAWCLADGPSRACIRRASLWTIAGLAAAGTIALLAFVLPHWADYRFYNWQMSVTRKPSYDVRSLVDRVSWFPILHDIFTRMWFTVVVGAAGAAGVLVRWRRAGGPERLLLLWLGLAALEVMLHDVGNERRFLIFVPPLVALTAIVLGRERRLLPPETAEAPRRTAMVALPLVLFALYVVFGTIVRLTHLYEVGPNVRLAAALAVVCAAAIYSSWPWLPRRLSRDGWTPRAALLLAGLVCAGQLAQFVQWAAGRTYKNYTASVELGRILPPGTIVHGKLATGLALENRIRPIFVGRGFGNYEDRRRRDDVRYILTYVSPSLGYESQAHNPVIQDILDAYPDHRILMTFDVAETAAGHDRAALIDKFGTGGAAHGQRGTDGGGNRPSADRHPAGSVRARD